MSADDLAGAIAYQLVQRLVVDMPTARAAVDAALADLPYVIVTRGVIREYGMKAAMTEAKKTFKDLYGQEDSTG